MFIRFIYLLFLFNVIFSETYSGYFRQSEVSFCMDECSQYYIENEIAFKDVSKSFTHENNNKREILYKPKNSFYTRSLNTKQVILLLGKTTVRFDNESDTLLRLLSCYLGYGMSSLLFKVLREEYGVVYEAGIYHPIRQHRTPFIMHASTTEEKAILTLKLMKECWGKVISSEISQEELDRLKIKYRGQIAHSLQSISQRAEYKAHLLGIGQNKNHDKEIIQRLEGISRKDLKNTANLYLKSPSLSICSNKKVIHKISNYWDKQLDII